MACPLNQSSKRITGSRFHSNAPIQSRLADFLEQPTFFGAPGYNNTLADPSLCPQGLIYGPSPVQKFTHYRDPYSCHAIIKRGEPV
jgi:hypothetical protein